MVDTGCSATFYPHGGMWAVDFPEWLGARRLRVLGIIAVTAIIGHLAWQAYLANFSVLR